VHEITSAMDATAVARDGKRLRMGDGFAGDRPMVHAVFGGARNMGADSAQDKRRGSQASGRRDRIGYQSPRSSPLRYADSTAALTPPIQTMQPVSQ